MVEVTREDALPIRADGMTLRDYFAAQALAGLCANRASMVARVEGLMMRAFSQDFAAEAYAMADAMLAARGEANAPKGGE